MKIAVTVKNGILDEIIEPRFGRADKFLIYDSEDGSMKVIDNQQNLNAAQGAGIQVAQTVINGGAEVLVSGHCGPKAFKVLSASKVKIYSIKDKTIKEVIDLVLSGSLKELKGADVEGHWA